MSYAAQQDMIDRFGEDEIVELTELPMTHMKTTAVQVKVRAVGKLHAGAL